MDVAQAGLQVRSFASGQEFLGAYRLGDAGCLVLDVRMPEMDGLALQQILRERMIGLPIIFITAYRDLSTCVRAFHGGAIDFLQKPVNDKALLERIESLVAD